MSSDDRPWLALVLLLILVNRVSAYQPGFEVLALWSAALSLLVCLARILVVTDKPDDT